jgi:hypothetical protein
MKNYLELFRPVGRRRLDNANSCATGSFTLYNCFTVASLLVFRAGVPGVTTGGSLQTDAFC